MTLAAGGGDERLKAREIDDTAVAGRDGGGVGGAVAVVPASVEGELVISNHEGPRLGFGQVVHALGQVVHAPGQVVEAAKAVCYR